MPALETRAVLLTLQWRSRSVARLSRKFIHLSDSQSTLGCLTKHRSGACSLTYLVERSTPLQLASGMEPILAFVRTHVNPADQPSRQKMPVRKALRSVPKLCTEEACLQPSEVQCSTCKRALCSNHAERRGGGEIYGRSCCVSRKPSRAAPQLPRPGPLGEGAATA